MSTYEHQLVNEYQQRVLKQVEHLRMVRMVQQNRQPRQSRLNLVVNLSVFRRMLNRRHELEYGIQPEPSAWQLKRDANRA